MPRLPQKAPFQCPGCGFVQFEPPRLVSTFCQSCGDYYAVGRGISEPPPPLPPAAFAKRIEVRCHRCGSTHAVSPHAQSTLCPCCNSAIEMGDRTFLLPASRVVDIRGKLTIGPAGSLSSSWIVCGSAHIEGLVVGVLRSEGEVHLANTGVCACQITAPAILVDKNARVSLPLPAETGHLEVRGHLSGVIHCNGVVHVRRGGRLEAEVHARAVRVEKGGALIGSCHVDGAQPAEPSTQLANDDRDTTLWFRRLCPA